MIIDITDVLTSAGKSKEEVVSVTMEQFEWVGEVYSISNQPQVTFIVTNVGMNQALIEGKTKMTLRMPCSRCLRMVEVPVRVRFVYKAVSPDRMVSSDEELVQLMEEGRFDVDELIGHELISNLPSKVLCREDCRGICRECGQDLNEKECGCDTFVPDPGMAAIKDIFDAYKEV